MSHQVVGKPIGRVEGPEKVTGKARYGADLLLPGLLWGKVVRGPLPHARVRGINIDKARALPGVHAVLTAADIPELLHGRRMLDMPLLARDRVRYIGEPVAVVAAEDPDLAEEAAALVDVEYAELPAVFDPLDALKDGAPLLHENSAGYQGAPKERSHPNVQSIHSETHGDPARGFGEAVRVFEHSFSTPLAHQGYIEPHAAMVTVDDTGRVQVWASHKMPFRMKGQLAYAIQLPPDRIRINLVPVGGDFGGKGFATDVPLCYYLAHATGRPVKMVMTYAEELMASDAEAGRAAA